MYLRESERELGRQGPREKQTPSEPGAWRGTGSWDSRIATWARGNHLTSWTTQAPLLSAFLCSSYPFVGALGLGASPASSAEAHWPELSPRAPDSGRDDWAVSSGSVPGGKGHSTVSAIDPEARPTTHGSFWVLLDTHGSGTHNTSFPALAGSFALSSCVPLGSSAFFLTAVYDRRPQQMTLLPCLGKPDFRSLPQPPPQHLTFICSFTHSWFLHSWPRGGCAFPHGEFSALVSPLLPPPRAGILSLSRISSFPPPWTTPYETNTKIFLH